MQDNVFRFVNLRPPQRKAPLEGTIDYIDPYGGGRYDTEFRQRLAQALTSSEREGARTEADNYIKKYGIVNDLANLGIALAAFDQAIVALSPDADVITLSELVVKVFDGEPKTVIERDDFQLARRNLADSLTAAFFASSLPNPRLSPLVRGIRLCELIGRIAIEDEVVALPDGVKRVLRASIVIPFDLFLNVGLVDAVVSPVLVEPGSTTTERVKPAGVSDLLIVRQTLRRYERGEIAHVENALKGESKERTYRRTQTTETLLFQETETTTEQEHDLQSTERFELKNEANKTVKEDMRAQAGLTVTGSYGPVAATVTGQFAFERSVEEATRSASTYARDVVERSRSRLQEQTLERRSTRSVLEVEETAKHGIVNNKEGADHIVGIYRWLDKIYEAQIVNYGKRLMIEFYVPEPAAYHRVIEANHLLKGLTHQKPEKPVVPRPDGSLRDFQPEDVEWPAVQGIAAQYGAVGIQPPPPPVEVIGTSIEVPLTDKDYDKTAPRLDVTPPRWLPALGGTKVSGELKITKGYVAISAEWSGQQRAYVRKSPVDQANHPNWGNLEEPTHVSIGSQTGGLNGSASFSQGFPGGHGFSDTLPVAVITSAAGLIVTFRVVCHRTAELVPEWQVKTYDVIMAAYRDQLQQYEEEVARLNVEGGIRISGRPPAGNRTTEHTELKRAAVSILTKQHFDHFDAFDNATPSDDSKSPRINFARAALEGTAVQYFEQSFEWHNMTYLFYPYFWGKKSRWPDVFSQESTDPLFTQFLRAGYARVQVPVRPNYETMVLYFLETFKLWQEAEDAPVSKLYLPLVDEIRNQTGDDFTIAVETINVQKGRAQVTGNNTQFTKNDVDREIRVQSKVYRIASFQSATAITLAKPFAGEDDANAAYSLGPKLVGPSWEVRLPTTLVMIDKPDVVLPSWSED